MSPDALGRAVHLLPADEHLVTEVQVLAELLADVVQLARNRAVFPGRWEQIAKLALEHQCVRAALQPTDMTRSGRRLSVDPRPVPPSRRRDHHAPDLYDQVASQEAGAMSAVFDPTADRAQTNALVGPLSSIEIHARRSGHPKSGSAPRPAAARPLALCELRPAPQRDLPEYLYDPIRQVATDPDGQPLEPDLKKDWTTIEGTHTDGDGGDNELWEWEEVK